MTSLLLIYCYHIVACAFVYALGIQTFLKSSRIVCLAEAMVDAEKMCDSATAGSYSNAARKGLNIY